MASKWRYWKAVSNFGFFGSGVIAATVISAYKFKSEEAKAKDQYLSSFPENTNSFSDRRSVTLTQSELKHDIDTERLAESIHKAKQLCERAKTKYGLPGLSIAVAVNGINRFTEGFGFSDLENEVPMRPEVVGRIGSISKSMTMAMLGQLMEDGKVNLDLPVQTYVPKFPQKKIDGKEVTITTRQLLSHLSGIRHYLTKEELEMNSEIDEMNLKEYFLKDKFESVEKSLEIFQNDELLSEPGSKFNYTTHGWTLVSAVLETITGTPFEKYAKRMFKKWGLKHTFLDEPDPIIYHRARPYSWNKKAQSVQNSPYVDNSYKWAGGGFLSSVEDIVQFGHIMLASFQYDYPLKNGDACDIPPSSEVTKSYLNRETVMEMWKGDPKTARPGLDFLYGLGFKVAEPMRQCFFCQSRDLMSVTHGGAAIGGSSVLLMTFPKDFVFGYDETDTRQSSIPNGKVKGVVVAMLTNLTSVPLTETAQEITKLFEWLI